MCIKAKIIRMGNKASRILKLQRFISEQGARSVIRKSIFRILYGIRPMRSLVELFIFKGDLERRFRLIHRLNYWNSFESVSGNGSTIFMTSELKLPLIKLMKKFEIQSICDAPCGDFSWMKEIISEINILYKGIDIVPELIKSLRVYEKTNISFEQGDIRFVDFSNFDLILVRDCLFHLSYDDIDTFLRNLSKYDYKYLLTTSYVSDSSFHNIDIDTGDFRKIDLFSHPFNFSSSVSSSIPDWAPPESERYLYMWEKKKVPVSLF